MVSNGEDGGADGEIKVTHFLLYPFYLYNCR